MRGDADMNENMIFILIFGIYSIIVLITILVWIDEDEDEYRSENEDWYNEE